MCKVNNINKEAKGVVYVASGVSYNIHPFSDTHIVSQFEINVCSLQL